MILVRAFLLFVICSITVTGRRRVSEAERAFEKNERLSWEREEDDDNSKSLLTITNKKISTTKAATTLAAVRDAESSTPKATLAKTTITLKAEDNKEDDVVTKLLRDTFDIFNLTRLVEQEHADSLEDALNRTVLWIDASYKAEDFKLNVSSFPECKAWKRYWNITNGTTNFEGSNRTLVEETPVEEMATSLKETELVDTKKRLKKLGLNEELLEVYKAVGLVYKEICGEHERTLWFRGTEDAKRLGITETSPICEPFKEDLNPDAVTLAKLARSLNEIISNTSEGNQSRTDSRFKTTQNTPTNVMYENYDAVISDKNFPTTQKTEFPRQEVKLLKESILEKNDISADNKDILVRVVEESNDRIVAEQTSEDTENEIVEATQKPESAEIRQYDDDYWDYVDLHKRFKAVSPKRLIRGVTLRVKRSTGQMDGEMKDDDDDWMETVVNRESDMNVNIATGAPEKENVVVEEEEGNNTERTLTQSWIEIDATEETHPTLLITSAEAAYALSLNIRSQTFLRYEKVGLYLPGICADYVPKAIDAFNSSSFEGIEIEGPIGVNITALEAAGVNLTALAEKLRNDTEVDDILSRTNISLKTLGGSFILPVLHKNQYDPFSAPIVFQGSAVVVKFGIYIESMSNFQTSTMDYDMDIYLMMAWRDARLVNPYDKPILVKEEEILEKIWRPDPFFANAKEAEFHEVTFLNFLMRIFPDGLVLYETRVKITPSCNLILCKYPHDKQTCDLLIKSFGYPIETVRFEWFTRRIDAIDKNPDVKLPELYIDRYEPTMCNKTRKSGAFSCLRAVFRLKRDVGFHIAQTYIPTSLALMFSWVGVWLPEEFMEGRIGVAITVLLTLSTESAGAREHLPSVSYLKAVDLWFGFITGFVFFTLLQTLFVIGFDKRANQLKKWAMKKKSDVTEELRDAMMQKAKRYHKTGRYLDNFCRVFYPLSFILFLIMYYFVFTEGRQDDCINRR